MQNVKPVLEGKKVAVFGLGDSVSYSENFADATGEVSVYRLLVLYLHLQSTDLRNLYPKQKLHDVFESLGCKMLGYSSTEGYLHDASKSQRGDNFIGLLLDAVNQEELTEERVKKWVASLKDEGILEGSSAGMALEVSVAEPKVKVEIDTAVNGEHVTQRPKEIAAVPDASGFVAHYNPRTDSTMWINVDGRSSFVTNGKP